MKLTKYAHACFSVEKDGQMLVIDPGNFSSDFIAPDHVAAVVITHQHPDHFDREQLAAIVDKNPEVLIIAPASVCQQIEVFETQPVGGGDTLAVGPFSLEIFSATHAVITPNIAAPENIGVMINQLIYYPGDSFTLPDRAVDTLALPAAAPWMKISEATAFLQSVQPRFTFPTHDAILSGVGQSLVDGILSQAARTQAISYQRLTDPIEI